MSIASRITSMTEHIDDIYDAVELTGVDTTGVNKNLVNVPNTLKDGYVDIINNGTDTLYENFPKVSQTGEEPTLNGVYEAPMVLEPKGNTEQSNAILPNGYTQVDYIESTGNQYLDTGVNADSNLRVILDLAFNEPTGTNQNVGAINTSSGNIRYHVICVPNSNSIGIGMSGIGIINTINLDSNRHLYDIKPSDKVAIIDGQSYTLAQSSITFDTQLNFYLFARNSTGSIYLSKTKLWACKMYASGTLVRDFIPCYRNSDNVIGLYDLVNDVFYVNNSSSTIPFNYGSIVSIPNPDYPQDVKVVKGNNTIKVTGKNLLKPDVSTTNTRGTTTTYNSETGYFTTTGTTTSSYPWLIQTSINIPSGTTVTLSTNINYETYARCYYTENDYEQLTPTNPTKTLEHDITRVVVLSNIASNVQVNETYYLQVEQGSTATTYQPYTSTDYAVNIGNMELCKIGDYQDRIYKRNDKWYLEKKVGKITLNGTEEWGTVQAYSRAWPVVEAPNILVSTSATDLPYLYCNYYNAYKLGDIVNSNPVDYGIGKRSNHSELLVRNKDADTVASLKTWLNTHNTIVYYALATPTTTEITDTDLIAELEALKSAKSVEGQTNITQTNADLPFIINASALSKI